MRFVLVDYKLVVCGYLWCRSWIESLKIWFLDLFKVSSLDNCKSLYKISQRLLKRSFQTAVNGTLISIDRGFYQYLKVSPTYWKMLFLIITNSSYISTILLSPPNSSMQTYSRCGSSCKHSCSFLCPNLTDRNGPNKCTALSKSISLDMLLFMTKIKDKRTSCASQWCN